MPLNVYKTNKTDSDKQSLILSKTNIQHYSDNKQYDLLLHNKKDNNRLACFKPESH